MAYRAPGAALPLRWRADAPELVVGQVVIATVASVGAGGRAVSLTTKTGSVAKAAVGGAAGGAGRRARFQADLDSVRSAD